MELKPDCLRDIMLELEQRILIDPNFGDGKREWGFSPVYVVTLAHIFSERYTKEEIVYHVVQLSESGYLLTNLEYNKNGFYGWFTLTTIYHITPQGHEFIANTKEKTRWSAVSSVLKSLGSVSLAVIETVAKGVTSAAAEECLKIHHL